MTTVKLSFLVFVVLAADPCPPNPPKTAVVLLLDFERLNMVSSFFFFLENNKRDGGEALLCFRALCGKSECLTRIENLWREFLGQSGYNFRV